MIKLVVLRTLAEESAAETLTAIGSRQLSPSILPWIPLMRDGGKASIIKKWQRLAQAEADRQLCFEYAGLALVLAELPGVWSEWKRALEGWNMRASQQVLEWQAEAKLEQRRADLMHLLELRCKKPLPADLATTIRSMTNMAELARWFEAAATVSSYKAFREVVQR